MQITRRGFFATLVGAIAGAFVAKKVIAPIQDQYLTSTCPDMNCTGMLVPGSRTGRLTENQFLMECDKLGIEPGEIFEFDFKDAELRVHERMRRHTQSSLFGMHYGMSGKRLKELYGKSKDKRSSRS